MAMRVELSRHVLVVSALILTLALLPALPAPGAAQGRPQAPPPSDEEIIERILELREELERLLQALSPEGRRALERRLAERGLERPEGPHEEGGTSIGSVPDDRSEEGGTSERGGAAAEASPQTRTPREPEAEAVRSAGGTPGTEARSAGEVVPSAPEGSARGPAVSERCNTLALLDTQEDGVLDARDRYWRYLYLWRDRNRDGELQDSEVSSLYEEGVRSLGVGLETFGTEGDGMGLVRLSRWIVLDVAGNGFAGTIAGDTDDAALVVDSPALGRGNGPELLDPGGEALEGYQPFRSLLRLRLESGEILELTCPG